MPPQAQNQPQRQGLGDLKAWYTREMSSGEIWSMFAPPGFQLEQMLWDHIQAGLTHDKLQAFEAQLNHWGRQLMGAHRWDQVYAVANAVLGPGCYQLGAVMGIGLELHQMEKQLVGAAEAILQRKTLELGKVFVLAGMYEAAHPSRLGMMAMAVAPATWTFWAAGKVLDPFIGADMKSADVRVRKMLQEAYAIASDPKKLLGGAWGSMKKEYVDKWNRYVQLSRQPGLVNQFEAGEIAGGVLLEVALTVWAIVSGAEVAVAGARAAAGVGRALFTVGAEEFAALTKGSASIARAEAPEIVKFLEEGSPAAKGGGGAADPAMVKAFRVEGVGNQRIMIDSNGNVQIPEVLKKSGAERNLYINFGDDARAQQFLQQRLTQFPDNTIKSFDVPQSFLDELRTTAVPESQRSLFPTNPVIADPTKAADQFGLSAEQIEKLRQVIVPGSGSQ